MNFALTDEQSFLTEAADQAIARLGTVEGARAALESGQAPELWETAVEAGWTGLLVPEDFDGAGLGVLEAMLIVERLGRRLADARLLGHLPASCLLPRADLAAGDVRGCFVDGLDAVSVSNGALTGTVEWVLDAAGADVLVVGASDGKAYVVESAEVAPAVAYDGSRSLASVTLDSVAGERIEGADPVLAGRALQRALLAAEDLGAVSACLEIATEYAKDRQAFGRAIGSYQAIKHKLVEMLRLAELTRSLTSYAGLAWASRPQEFVLAANAARTTASEALDYAAAESIFIHGGIGATWESDCSLYYRRAEQSRRLSGGADAAADAVAAALLAEPRGFT
jgi:alkylation response protein AidB-like acyl-CoA dehydrogenase